MKPGLAPGEGPEDDPESAPLVGEVGPYRASSTLRPYFWGLTYTSSLNRPDRIGRAQQHGGSGPSARSTHHRGRFGRTAPVRSRGSGPSGWADRRGRQLYILGPWKPPSGSFHIAGSRRRRALRHRVTVRCQHHAICGRKGAGRQGLRYPTASTGSKSHVTVLRCGPRLGGSRAPGDRSRAQRDFGCSSAPAAG